MFHRFIFLLYFMVFPGDKLNMTIGSKISQKKRKQILASIHDFSEKP